MFSQLFMQRLVDLLPTDDSIEYSKALRRQNIDPRKIFGQYAYDQLIIYCSNEGEAMEHAASRSSSGKIPEKTKSKAVHATSKDQYSSDEDTPTVHAFQRKKNPTRNAPACEKDWANKKWKTPCGLGSHDHEITACKDFFTLTPYERRLQTIRKVCWTCFGLRQNCIKQETSSSGKLRVICSNYDRVKPMVCKDCITNCKENDQQINPPSNIMFCGRKNHSKPPVKEISKMLKEYFPDLDINRVSPTLVACVDAYSVPSVNITAGKSRSSAVKTNKNDITVDTHTGHKSVLDKSLILPEQTSPAVYIMQWIQIGKSKCLCFFDTGANIHMIDGKLAEMEELRVMSQVPTTLKVVGGSELITDYGTYRLNLGPNADGKYHELTCHGMNSMAGPFPRLNLQEVNDEVRDHVTVGTSEVLPEYVGGSMVHLLLGIRDASAQPIWLGTLPSGISVYRSPFTDIFGSNICYGGSHESFRTSKCDQSTNHAVLLINTLQEARDSMTCAKETVELQFQDLPSLSKSEITTHVHYSVEIGDEIHTEIFPTPLTQKDFEDAGCTISTKVLIEDQNLNHSDHDPVADQTDHWCSVYKAMVPIARLREIVDQEDVGDVVSYRCPACSKCVRCKESGKTRAITLQEAVEQDIIEKSVTIDREKGKVYVDLPFLKDPVPFLTQRHRGPNNLKSAKQVYVQQCRKPENHKIEMRKAHQELVDRGFMIRLKDLDQKVQDRIKNAPFQHYYPWRTVEKADSISTPIRMVVDPTMTGLNLILAKGENRLGKMNDILVRNRVKTHSWSSDISKMYNQLQLNEASYPYSLFLYNSLLEAEIDPEEWVMLVAWYGVVPTGNQAGFAVEDIAINAPPRFEIARAPLLNDRFVDDLAPGQMSEELRENQISLCKELLGTAGFSLKFVARSGSPPCSKASSDGVSLKMLGYSWLSEQDLLAPGISEMNFNKKIRGSKQPNTKPVVTREDAAELLKGVTLTRKMVASKVAELYDPVGIWEPLKLYFKLELSKLNVLDWDEVLDEPAQVHWKDILLQYVDIHKMRINRCVVPANADLSKGARLICISDAAEFAGGVAIYIGFHCTDGTISSNLLTAKSKLMNATIPRNELCAILLMTEIAFVTVRALEGLITEVIYVTDSTIALSWCHNIHKKLRLYVHSRVSSIRRMIEWTTGIDDDLPLYHIDGKLNIADLLTKKHDITLEDLDIGSLWQSGYPWMSLPLNAMPLMKYSELRLDKSGQSEVVKECYQEPFTLAHCSIFYASGSDEPCTEDCTNYQMEDVYFDIVVVATSSTLDSHDELSYDESNTEWVCHLTQSTVQPFLVDMVTLGWQRGKAAIANVIHSLHRWFHRSHEKSSSFDDRCVICLHRDSSPAERSAALADKAERYLFVQETKIILSETSDSQRKKFTMKDGILSFSGRLSEANQFTTADLDTSVFFDSKEFTGLVPVVRSSSPIFFSYAMYVHLKVRPHSGIETSVKEIMKKMYVPDAPRKIIKSIRNSCVKCKIMFKSTLDLEMSKHHFSRTMLTPVFYNCQMDVVFGFKGQPFKRSRTTFKIYALVIVCLLTSATNILVLEGMETQDVILAIERHSARYGVPAELFVDNGSQLIALQSASMSLRTIDTYLYDSLGMRVTVSNPKAHEERGRVEAKVKLVRSMLEKQCVDTSVPLTSIQWETVFSKVANSLDDLPMAKGNSSNVSDLGFDVITPNRLKLGRNNHRSLEGSIKMNNAALPSDLLDRNRRITSAFLQILVDRIHHFHHKPDKWLKSADKPPKVDDIVLFVVGDGNVVAHGKVWKLGRLVQVGETRVRIMYPNKSKPDKIPTWKFVERNWREISVLLSEDELYMNSNEYFNSIKVDALTTKKCRE